MAVNDELHIDLEDSDFLLVFPLRPKGRLRLVGNASELADRGERLTFDDVGSKAIDHLGLTVTRSARIRCCWR